MFNSNFCSASDCCRKSFKCKPNYFELTALLVLLNSTTFHTKQRKSAENIVAISAILFKLLIKFLIWLAERHPVFLSNIVPLPSNIVPSNILPLTLY